MGICSQDHVIGSEQTMLWDGVDIGPTISRGCGLNKSVHEGMNGISNVKVHLKIRSGNVNINSFNAHHDFFSFGVNLCKQFVSRSGPTECRS